MAADFIEWVQKQNFYHNTVITVPGDHVVRGKNSIYPQRSKYFLQSLILKRVRNRKNIAGQCLILRRRCRSRRFREQWAAPGQNLWKQHPALEEKYGLALDTEINKFSTSPEPGLKKPCSYTLGMKVTNPPTSSGTPLHIIKKSKPYGRTTCISKPTFHRPKTYVRTSNLSSCSKSVTSRPQLTCRLTEKARTNGQFSPMSKRRFVKNRFYPKHNRQ